MLMASSRSRTHSLSDGANLHVAGPPRFKTPLYSPHDPLPLPLPPPTPTPTPPPPRPTSLGTWGGTFLVTTDDAPANSRDSFISIVDDPFFQKLNGAAALQRSELVAEDLPPRHDPEPATNWPPPRRESLTVTNPTPWARPAATIRMETINIAVIGANGVGKSAFIQRALRLPRPPTTNINGMRLDVEGIPHIATLIELDLEYFDVDPSQPIRWPKQISGHMVPRIDGTLILYDVMNKESIRDLPPALSALGISNLPTILVATKCDNPESLRQLNADGMAQAFPSVLGVFKTSSNVPGSTRDCVQAIIKAAFSNSRGGDKSEAATRRRAASAAHLDTPPDGLNGRPLSDHSSKHSRASSDLSLLRGFPQSSSSADREVYYRGQNSKSPRIEYPHTPQLTASSFGPEVADDGVGQGASGMLRSAGIRLDAAQDSFLDIEESDAESYRYSDDIPILQRNDDNFLDRPAKMTGVAFDDLIERLLAPRMTRADNNFADVFLCLYRKFAAPGELFTAVVSRLDRAKEDATVHYLTRVATQLRIIEVIAKWVSSYPGDFARPTTRGPLDDLVTRLSAEPVFSVAAQQMRDHIDHDVIEDDDTCWANSDESHEEPHPGTRVEPKRGSELAESLKSHQMDDGGISGIGGIGGISMGGIGMSAGGGPGGGPGSDRRLSGSFEKTSQELAEMAQFQFHSLEDYEREAASMVPTATHPLNKNRYRIFMDLDADDIADEITRIDWIMFSSIRIRDLVRSVSLPLDQREKCRSLKNVSRMIAHFNHVAKWVANMVLIRDKAKHRAPCLQKFMEVAVRLRQLNNYNGLAAVLAGINGTAVHRLAQTRALVDADVQKRFARLGLLMGTQKSHFAYRLAWENSPLPRIPFMPLHRRDLVSAEEGSRTFVGPNGDRINWKKFEVLGEVLLPIMKSQGTPYPNLKKHELAREVILECRMPTDEEEIYQRSVTVEPGSGPVDSGKKKFPWLAK